MSSLISVRNAADVCFHLGPKGTDVIPHLGPQRADILSRLGPESTDILSGLDPQRGHACPQYAGHPPLKPRQRDADGQDRDQLSAHGRTVATEVLMDLTS